MGNNPDLKKEKRIKQEITGLNGLYKKMDNKKRKAVDALIKNVAFIIITLEDLQVEINEKGVTETH